LSWWNPYADPARVLSTAISPAECRGRLGQRVAGWLALVPSEARPLKGRVTEAGCAVHRFEFGRHGFETEARGRFEPGTAGTRITLRFGLKRLDAIMLALLILFVLGVEAAFLLEPGRRPGPATGDDPFLVWLPFLVPAVLALMYLVQRWHVRGDAEFLVRLIRETLGASEAREPGAIE